MTTFFSFKVHNSTCLENQIFVCVNKINILRSAALPLELSFINLIGCFV